MNDKEMSVMFAEILDQIKETNKNLSMLTNALTTHSDLLGRNNQIGEDLKKIGLNLGAVMAQGLSSNANVQLVEKAASFFMRYITK